MSPLTKILAGFLLANFYATCCGAETTVDYFLNHCPSASLTQTGYLNCILSESANLWVSAGPCQGAATKGDDAVFSSCYCRQQVEQGGCYHTVCPDSAMAIYTSSISKHDCPASVWATITADVASAPKATGANGEPASTSKVAAAGVIGPAIGVGLAWLTGVIAVLL